MLLERLRMRYRDTLLESHGRHNQTMYGESSVKVSPSRQPWVAFHIIRTKYATGGFRVGE